METTYLDVVCYAHKVMNRDKRLASPKEDIFFWNEDGQTVLDSREIEDYNAFEKVEMICSGLVAMADYPFPMDYGQIMNTHEQIAHDMRQVLATDEMVKKLQVSFVLVMIPIHTIYRDGLKTWYSGE